MNYTDDGVTGFLSDTYFREWVLNPNEANNLFWQAWGHRHPHQQEDMELARQVLVHQHLEPVFLPADRVESLWDSIASEVEDSPLLPEILSARERGKTGIPTWMNRVAALLGMMAAGLAMALYRKKSRYMENI